MIVNKLMVLMAVKSIIVFRVAMPCGLGGYQRLRVTYRLRLQSSEALVTTYKTTRRLRINTTTKVEGNKSSCESMSPP
jgi:hypothetical protein